MADDTVSVVVLTHDRRELLAATLGSVLAQRDVPLEVICVDNGSTDGTAAYLDALDDPRLTVHRLPTNVAPTHARNLGLAATSGSWVGFCDDDDLWAPQKARAQVRAANAVGASWAYSGCVYIDPAGALIGGAPPLAPTALLARLPQAYVVPAGLSGMLWRRGALDDGGRLDERLAFCDDWDVSLRLARQGAPACVSAPHVAFRQYGAKQSRAAAAHLDELDVLETKFGELLAGRTMRRGAHLRYAGMEALRAGERGEAAQAFLRAVRLGDRGAVLRLPAVLLPRRAQNWLRRRSMSDAEWLDEARRWLGDLETV